MNSIDVFGGIQITEDVFLTTKIKRSLKERFFSLPWKPWIKWNFIPDEKVYMVGGRLIGHPVTIRKGIKQCQDSWTQQSAI